MGIMGHSPEEREAQRRQASREELVERLARAVPADGTAESLPGLVLRRASATTELGHGMTYLSFCVIAQGAKEILLGEDHYRYDPAQYLIATAALPITTRIAEATSDQPYLGLVLELDTGFVASVMVEAGHIAARGQSAARAIAVSPLGAGLLDAVVRLTRLLETPAEARFMVPLIKREIVYRLLTGAQGGRLGHMVAPGGATQRIATAVERIRQNFNQPLRTNALAQGLGMSVSGFHHHFKQVTAMSPIQFQKQLRLQEARRLMLAEGLDAASAGFRVGYDDPSYFSREYKRLFGAPPLRHAERMRDAAWANAGV